MSNKVAHCSCVKGKLTRRPYHLRPTEVVREDGLDLCTYCNHAVVWVTPGKMASFECVEDEKEYEEEKNRTLKGYFEACEGIDKSDLDSMFYADDSEDL